MKEYNVKEVTEIFQISKRALRYYEEVELLHVHRNEKNHRIYDEKDCAILQSIVILKHMGFSIEDIQAQLDVCESGTFIASTLRKKKSELHLQILKTTQQMKHIECLRANYIDGDICDVKHIEHLPTMTFNHTHIRGTYTYTLTSAPVLILIFSILACILGLCAGGLVVLMLNTVCSF